MNKNLYRAAFSVGLLAIGWIAAGYLRTNPLALAMTALIVAFYLMGALELRRFHLTTSGLQHALDGIPEPLADLDDWLPSVPAPLRSAVQLRVDGDRIALPGPAMTPYLAGLLVLLGMLGTFLGMVVTLNGTGIALEHATDLQAMRDSLAAPVKGLGLAFGTSVAGVAASAMLGLMAALCRRHRLQAAQLLDTRIAGPLRTFTRAHRRQESFALLQRQAQLMPELVDRLQAVAAQIESQGRQANERLLASQERFQGQAEVAYRALASSVDQSLRQSLTESARIAGATIQPVVEATMRGIAQETTALQGQIAGTVQQQLDGLSARFESATGTVTDTWTTALARHERSSDELAQRLGATLDAFGRGFEQRSAALVDRVADRHAALTERISGAVETQLDGFSSQLDAAVRQVSSAWEDALESMSASLQREWQQAGAQALGQQARICETLEQTAGRISAQSEAHARSTIAEIARLVQTASEAPRAAAEVVAQLREKLSDSIARDNAMLEERSRIMAALGTLLDAVQQTSREQATAIGALVSSTASSLRETGSHFTERVDAESSRMGAVAAQLDTSAVEVASLGEAFGLAVQLFSQSTDKLTAHLQRVEETLARSVARSDEQLAYYVAQAREVIDLSLMSQKRIVEDLQRVAGRQAAQVDGA